MGSSPRGLRSGLGRTSRHRAGDLDSATCADPLDNRSHKWEHRDVRVFGETAIAEFAKQHPASRKPLQRFVAIARAAVWPHFPALKETFPATDYAPATGTLIFNVGGNKYRLIARVDFEEQLLVIQTVLTHREYDREDL
jgi:mRNA interferase HigB